MLEFINFCKAHYELIVSCLTLVISVVVFIIRKKPLVIDNQSSRILQLLCIQAVNAAEKTNLKGSEKLEYALIWVLNILRDIKPGIKDDDYVGIIVSNIEAILSTPQKK